MCDLLEEPFKCSTKLKNKQIKEWRSYFNFRVSGRLFTVFEIYPENIVADNVSIKNQKKFKKKCDSIKYNVHLKNKEDSINWFKSGVYRLWYKNNTYIGSTISNFYDRLAQHLSPTGRLPQVYDNILAHSRFKIEFLYIVSENDTEESIRAKESEYYLQFKQSKEWNIFNEVFPNYHKSLKNKQNKSNQNKKPRQPKEKKLNPLMELWNKVKPFGYEKYKSIKIKAPKEIDMMIISYLEQLDLVYYEDKDIWTTNELKEAYENYKETKKILDLDKK